MPTYFARSITARLGAMPLEDTLTSNIILKKGEAARQQAETSKAKLLESKLLAEKLVPFPGDERKLHVNWLGNAPFMQVRAGEDLLPGTDVTTDKTSPTELAPTALIIHLNLLDKTFVSGLQGQKTSLKIEILFNGLLASCRFMPLHDLRSGVQGYHQTFSGTRIDFLAERPWVFVPHELTAAGTARKNEDNHSTSAEERWQHICQALQHEVYERGMNEAGNIPPTAQFLSALATMHPPDQLHEMQQPGKKTFGTIDIIITAGEGKKITDGLGYLRAPQRMVDTNYSLVSPSDSGAESQHQSEPMPGSIHVDAEDNPRLEDEFHPKDRDSVSSVSPYSHSKPKRVFTQATIGANSNWTSSAGEFSRTFHEPPASGFGEVHEQVTDENDRYRDRGNGLHGPALTPRNLISKLSQRAFASQLYLSPHSIQVSDRIAEGTVSGGTESQMIPSTAVRLSRPLDGLLTSSHSSAQQVQDPSPVVRMEFDQVLSSSSPYAMPYFLPKRSTADSLNTDLPPLSHPVSPLMPEYQDSDGVQVATTDMRPWHHSQPPMMHNPRAPLASLPPFHYRQSGALPPIDFYSVPTKPKRSLSPQKQIHSKPTKKLCSSIPISRLVVKGRNGTVLIDRRWTPARILSTRPSEPYNRRDQTSVTVTTGEILGLTENDLDSIEIRDQQTEIGAEGSLEPYNEVSVSTKADTNSTGKPGSYEANAAELSALPVLYPIGRREGTSKARTVFGNRMSGVKEPTANPFGLEDPDVVLREASATQRRALRQTGQSKMQTVALTATTIRSAILESVMSGSVSTSPLSSLHTTPEVDMHIKAYTNSNKKAQSSLADPSAEMECFRRRELKSTLPHTTQDSSMTKRDTTSEFRVGQHPQATTKSASNRNRQANNRNIARKPRSPRRLQTNDNPMVNQDCVIAFAESKDRNSKQGVLRQVKGERAGVFTEQYVVSAMRFFVTHSKV